MRRYTVVLYPEPDAGGYSVLVPLLGVATQGETVEDGLAMARDLIALHVRGLEADGEDVPEEVGAPIVAAVEIPESVPA